MKTELQYLENDPARAQAVKIIKNGGIVIIPSDTIYSLSTALSSASGYRRILKLKNYEEERNFLLLADSVHMVEKYVCSWGCADKKELEHAWPAPLTAILPSGQKCPPWAGESIAFRVPDYDPIRRVISGVGEPILSTSVNVGGKAPLHMIDKIIEKFGGEIDFVAAGRRPAQDLPSTIVDFTKSEPKLVREGSYRWTAGFGKPSKA